MEAVWTEVVTVCGLIVVTFINLRHGRQIKRIDANSAATAKQTVNDHEETEYPNLRDEQTAIRAQVGKLSETVNCLQDDVKATRGLSHGMKRQLDRVEVWMRDLSDDKEALNVMVERKQQAQERALQAAVEDRNIELHERDRAIADIHRKLREVDARCSGTLDR